MENSSVAIAAIALAGTAVGAVIWIVKYLASTLSKDLQEHTKAALIGAQASREQKKASTEVLIFMRNLNGKLAKATISTAKSNEQILHNLEASTVTLKKKDKDRADAVNAVRVIAAEDRDVLTNQNKHIRTEVKKIMKDKK